MVCRCLLLILALASWHTFAETINKNVTREINLSESVVRIVSIVKVAGAQKNYIISYPSYLGDNLAFHAVYRKGKACKCTAPFSVGNRTMITAKLSDSSPTLKIVAVFTNAVSPFPRQIRQDEAQYVRYVDNLYFTSPYPTALQKTILTLASTSIVSHSTDHAEPYSLRKNVLTYGSYRDISAYQDAPLDVHFRNDASFLRLVLRQEVVLRPALWAKVLSGAERLVVEEEVSAVSHGAELVGGFSRYSHQRGLHAQSMVPPGAPVITRLVTQLPATATAVRFRDQIGNISTSSVHYLHGLEPALELELQPRHPLLGGWRTLFYIGYELPPEAALSTAAPAGGRGERHTLHWELFSGFRGAYVQSQELKLVLPAGAVNIEVEVPVCLGLVWGVERAMAEHPGLLFGSPQPVVVLRSRNLVAEHHSRHRRGGSGAGDCDPPAVSYELAAGEPALSLRLVCAVAAAAGFCFLCSFIACGDLRSIVWALRRRQGRRLPSPVEPQLVIAAATSPLPMAPSEAIDHSLCAADAKSNVTKAQSDSVAVASVDCEPEVDYGRVEEPVTPSTAAISRPPSSGSSHVFPHSILVHRDPVEESTEDDCDHSVSSSVSSTPSKSVSRKRVHFNLSKKPKPQ
jgi:oligosaccharyltransferase complex subunit alpha (ribophorin I)